MKKKLFDVFAMNLPIGICFLFDVIVEGFEGVISREIKAGSLSLIPKLRVG